MKLTAVAGSARSSWVDWNYLHFIENSGGTLGTLTLTNGTNDVALRFAGDFTPSDFIITPGTTTTTIAHS